jgi:DNA-binding transcriptional MerR regulator/Tfp pilus assembly protein PilF
VSDLYSIKDVAQIFGLEPSRLRYWAQTGFVNPSVRRGGRMFYTFQDLVAVRTAKDLLDAGLSLQKVRKNLESLRALLPEVAHPASKMRICSDGETVVAVDGGVAFEPATGQVVMSFTVEGLSSAVAEILALPGGQPMQALPDAPAATGPEAAPAEPDAPAGEPHTAYQCFLHGCAAEDRGELGLAEQLYRQAILAQPSLAAACTNLGNLLYRRGALGDARAAYEHALEYEPGQAEARYNLGNLLEDMGETELSIAELRRVCWTHPEFADAHYNLGLMLARVGGIVQARKHLERYLELESESEWATRARDFLDALRAARPAASHSH